MALYCSEAQEDRLTEYLESAKDAVGKPMYDPQAALQLSRQYHLDRASIELLWQLHLFEVGLDEQCTPFPTSDQDYTLRGRVSISRSSDSPVMVHKATRRKTLWPDKCIQDFQ